MDFEVAGLCSIDDFDLFGFVMNNTNFRPGEGLHFG